MAIVWVPVNGSGSVQPDWNQNDATQVDYVKNRTHYIVKTHDFSCSGPYTWTAIGSSDELYTIGMRYSTSLGLFEDEIFNEFVPSLCDISGMFGMEWTEAPSHTVHSTSGILFMWQAAKSRTGYCAITLYSSKEGFYGQNPTLSNFKTVKQIQEAYIPNSIARTSDVELHTKDTNNPHGLTADKLGAHDIINQGTALSTGDNLNNYTTPGVYYSSGSGISGSIVNAPYSDMGFRMLVERTYMSGGVIQIVLPTTTVRPIMFRNYHSNTWYPWRTVYDSGNGSNITQYVDGKLKTMGGTEVATGGHVVSNNAPTNTSLLWIDTSAGGVLKYHDGSAWVATKSVWG